MPTKPKTHKPKAVGVKHEVVRASAKERGYDWRWAKYSRWRLRQPEHCLCVMCGRPAQCTDHIVPFRGDEELKWNENNLQSLCKRCHDQKTAREDGAFGREAKKR